MAHVLKPGCCSSAGNSNCVMNIEAVGKNPESLLLDFLCTTLQLTHLNQTIFCSMNVQELTQNRLVAQVFGQWFDALDNRINSIKDYGFSSNISENGDWKSTVMLEFEIDAPHIMN